MLFNIQIALLSIVLIACSSNKGEKGDSIVGPPGDSIVGPPGRDGTDANPVTYIQFCPGQSSNYGSFPEVGICQNGDLYAVFWSGGNAWLTKLHPGNYKTTSTGLICNFKVKPNCIVEPN